MAPQGLLGPLVAVLLVTPAWGEEAEQPLEEVFQTELVYPQEQGEFQLTLAPQWQRGSEEDRFQARVSLEYGLTDELQIGLEWDAFSSLEPENGERVEGIGDLEIGLKRAWMDPEGHLHVAVGLEVGLPLANVDDGLSEGLLEIQPFLALARDFPRHRDLQLFAQLGLGLVSRVEHPQDPEEEEEPEAHELEVSVGLFLPTEPALFTLEVNWSTNTWNNDGEENELYLTPGFVWPLDDGEIGLGVPIGLNDDADDVRLIAMWTTEF